MPRRNISWVSCMTRASESRVTISWPSPGIKAAVQGYRDAQFNLGVFYVNKRRDYKQASAWFQKAAVQGDVEAQRNLHRLYMEEYGD